MGYDATTVVGRREAPTAKIGSAGPPRNLGARWERAGSLENRERKVERCVKPRKDTVIQSTAHGVGAIVVTRGGSAPASGDARSRSSRT
jgi:hypothetical protein